MGLLEKDKRKKYLQKGGEEAENKLRINISKKILNILEKCREEQGFRGEMKELNDKYHILENTYIFLGISRNQNKCDILRDILILRRNPLGHVNYSNQQYPLFHCLSSDDMNIHVAEMSFCIDHNLLLKQKTGITTNFYNYWNKFIMFLRRIIREIEREILKNVRKTNEFLEKTRSELKNAADKNFDEYSKKERDEIAKGIKLMNNQEKAQSRLKNSNNDLRSLRKLMINRETASAGPGPANADPANNGSLLMKTFGKKHKNKKKEHAAVPENVNNDLRSLRKLMINRETASAGPGPANADPANNGSLLMKTFGKKHKNKKKEHAAVPENVNNDLRSLRKLMINRETASAGPGPANAGPANNGSLLMKTFGKKHKNKKKEHAAVPENVNNDLNSLKILMRDRLTANAGPANQSFSLMKPFGRRRHLMNNRLTANAGPANQSSSLMKPFGRRGKKTVNSNTEAADAERQLIIQKNPNLNNEAGHTEFRHIMNQKNTNTSNLEARLAALRND